MPTKPILKTTERCPKSARVRKSSLGASSRNYQCFLTFFDTTVNHATILTAVAVVDVSMGHEFVLQNNSFASSGVKKGMYLIKLQITYFLINLYLSLYNPCRRKCVLYW